MVRAATADRQAPDLPVHDMADVDLLPATFGLDYVAFKAGRSGRCSSPLSDSRAGPASHGPSRLASRRAAGEGAVSLRGVEGRREGGVAFEVTGLKDGSESRRSLAITSERDGGRIPSVLASIAAQAVLAGRYTQPGVADVGGWIDPEDWIDALSRRGLTIWHRADRREPWIRGPAPDRWPQDIDALAGRSA